MKMIDVLVKLADGEIKKGTKLVIVTPKGREYEYEYDINFHNGDWSFVDDYERSISYWFDITVDTLQYEARLIEQKEKKYRVEFNMRGLREDFAYLNYFERINRVMIHDEDDCGIYKTHFTKSELQSIQPVREFLEDMKGKYELIEVEE